jgi:hypothetical protein
VTLRTDIDVPSLRDEQLLTVLKATFRAASTPRFRVVAFSIQADHLHLVAEADGPTLFTRGMQGLAIRVAKAVNRALGRPGRVWGDRYHARLLRTPREVRTALVYVLNNFRKHVRASSGLDPYSSASWFDGWRSRATRSYEASPVVAPRTWLGHVGWRRGGLIDPDEFPRAKLRPRGRRRRGRAVR